MISKQPSPALTQLSKAGLKTHCFGATCDSEIAPSSIEDQDVSTADVNAVFCVLRKLPFPQLIEVQLEIVAILRDRLPVTTDNEQRAEITSLSDTIWLPITNVARSACVSGTTVRRSINGGHDFSVDDPPHPEVARKIGRRDFVIDVVAFLHSREKIRRRAKHEDLRELYAYVEARARGNYPREPGSK